MRNALVNHLQDYNQSNQAETIKSYAGELTDRDKGMRLRINLPAILVLVIEGFPLRDVKESQFSLLFLTETVTLSKEDVEEDAVKLVDTYMNYLWENYRFEDEHHYYHLVDLQNSRATLLMNDHKYTIFEVPVFARIIS